MERATKTTIVAGVYLLLLATLMAACSDQGDDDAAGSPGGSGGTGASSGSAGATTGGSAGAATGGTAAGGTGGSAGAGTGGAAAGQGGTSGSAGTGGSGGSSGCTPAGPTVTELGASYEKLAKTSTILNSFGGIAVREGSVYYGENGIMRVAPDGTLSTVLPDLDAFGLEIEGDTLYFVTQADDDSLVLNRLSLATSGAAPEVMQQGFASPYVRTASSIVYTDTTAETLLSLPLGPPPGGTAMTLLTDVAVEGLGFFDDAVYVTDFNAEAVLKLAGSTPQTLFEDDFSFLGPVTATAADVYFGDRYTLRTVKSDGSSESPTLLGAAGPGGFGNANFDALKVAGDRIYWLDDGANAGWTAKDGSSCGLIVRDVNAPWIDDIEVDDQYVYLAIQSDLVRIPR